MAAPAALLGESYIGFPETIIIGIVWGISGVVFYLHRVSYVMVVAFSVIVFFIWPRMTIHGMSPGISFFLFWSFGPGFTLGAIVSRILHALKKI
jgi:hypothetical protein